MPTRKTQTKRDNVQNTAEYLEHIISLLPGHVYWKDINGVLLGCNDAQAKFIGLASRHDIVGLTAYDTLPKNFADEITSIDTEVMNTGIPRTIEEILILPTGEQSIWLSQKVPLYSKQGDIIGILGISFDITEKKRTEKELQETRHKLDGMTLVSASLAHELRTPLATISIIGDNLQEYLPDLLDAYRLAKQAELPIKKIKPRNFQLLERLLTSLKSVTRAAFTFIDMLLMNVRPSIEQGAIEVFSIAKCVNDALERYPYQQGQKQLIKWQPENDFLVEGKSILVIHVIFNLLKNALHYIAAVQKGDISIWLENGGSFNRLYFKDTGAGIPEDILPHIFERFFTRTYHGAGIGLTFCKMVMESVGGTITCESIEGSYTQFILSFPNDIEP